MNTTIQLPGDKSISHRIAMLAALAAGPCAFRNFNTGADCASTLRCLQDLGAEVERSETVRVISHPLHSSSHPLDCGNSGSTIRMMTGLLAGQNLSATLVGDESLQKRPMKRVADPLRAMGAVIELREEQYAPIVLREGAKHSIEYEVPVSSAQVKSAILFAGLRFPGTVVREAIATRDHTERLLAWLEVKGGKLRAFDYDVPGDPSSAAFFIVGALLKPGSELTIRSLLVNPHRTGCLRVLQRAGAYLVLENEKLFAGEPVADLKVRSGPPLSRIVIGADEVPSLIDELPALSLLGIRYGFELHGASELRHKESDRITAMVENLRALGIETREYADGYSVEPGQIKPAMIRTHGDHRIAMAFAVAGLELDHPECVNISFPEFFDIQRLLNTPGL